VGAAPCRASGTIQGKALRPPLVEHAPAAHSLEQLQPLCGRASSSKKLPVLLSSLFRPNAWPAKSSIVLSQIATMSGHKKHNNQNPKKITWPTGVPLAGWSSP
jgi:hypothetical protein